MEEPFDIVTISPKPPRLDPETAALLIVDLQYLDAHPDYGLGLSARKQGRADVLAYRFDRIEGMLPRIERLANGCRRSGMQVIYVKIATHREDGRDGSPSLRGLVCVEGSKEAEILSQIAPQPGDIIVTKSSLSAFTSAPIDDILRHLGVRTLICTGIVTNGCVELTMRDAADRGYFGVLVEDCCGANSERLHRDALDRMNRGLLRVSNSDAILAELGNVAVLARALT